MLIAHFQKKLPFKPNVESITDKNEWYPPQKHLRCKKARPRNYKYLEPNVKKQKENSSAEVKSNW